MTNNYQLDTNDIEDDFTDDEEKINALLEIQFSLCKRLNQPRGGPELQERLMKSTRLIAYLIQVKNSLSKTGNSKNS